MDTRGFNGVDFLVSCFDRTLGWEQAGNA